MTSKTNKGIELHVEAKLIYESANTSIQIFQKASSSAFAGCSSTDHRHRGPDHAKARLGPTKRADHQKTHLTIVA